MKQNLCTVHSEVAELTCIGFDKLNCTVEARCTRVADSVLAVWCLSILTTFLTGSDLLCITLIDQALKNRLAAPL
jgi:hypothetical protein